MSKKFLRPFVLTLAITVLFACAKENEPIAQKATSTPKPAPTVQPAPEGTPAPSPTPSGPDFAKIRRNREIMTPEQVYRYGRNMAGRKIGGCVGYLHSILESDEAGKSRVIVDYEPMEGTLPDFILEGIPSEIAQQLKARQTLNFSGTIQGYEDIPAGRFLMVLSDVKIFGYID